MKKIHALPLDEFERASRDGAAIVDLRSPDDFSIAFIPNSINITLDDQFSRRMEYFLLHDQAVILVCDEGKEEENLQTLTSMGLTNIWGYLEGGFNNWQNNKRPIDVVISIEPDELELEFKYGTINLYDIRSAVEFNKIHILNSENIDPLLLIDNLELMDKDALCTFYCDDGTFSMSLISFLKKNNIHNIYHIKGGFENIKNNPAIMMVAEK